MKYLIIISLLATLFLKQYLCNEEGSEGQNDLAKSTSLYSIEGKVFPLPNATISSEWFTFTRIIVNYGQYLGFMK